VSRRNQVTKSIRDTVKEKVSMYSGLVVSFNNKSEKSHRNVGVFHFEHRQIWKTLIKMSEFSILITYLSQNDDMTNLTTTVNPTTITCTLLLMTNCIWYWMTFQKKNLISMSERSESSKDLLQINMMRDTSKKCY
jgi:hypothetical protein